jgi:uncharacterized protein YjbJ (UPF0337 family)
VSVFDKAKAQAQETAGKVKENLGRATDDEQQRDSGISDQAAGKTRKAGADAKQGAEKAKQRSEGAFNEAKDRMTGKR